MDNSPYYEDCGGAGAFISGLLDVYPNTQYRIIVGKRGVCESLGDSQDKWGGGGVGYLSNYVGCGGGGRSAIQAWEPLPNGTYQWQDIVVAGGGGGVHGYVESCEEGGGGAASWNSTGRRGGDQVQTTESSLLFVFGGLGYYCGGGSNTSGGQCPHPGGKGYGGDAITLLGSEYIGYGSGGGGGWYGGGGGATLSADLSAGGGGSSYIERLASPVGDEAPPDRYHQSPGTWSEFWDCGSGDGYHCGVGASARNGRVVMVALCVDPSSSATRTASRTATASATPSSTASPYPTPSVSPSPYDPLWLLLQPLAGRTYSSTTIATGEQAVTYQLKLFESLMKKNSSSSTDVRLGVFSGLRFIQSSPYNTRPPMCLGARRAALLFSGGDQCQPPAGGFRTSAKVFISCNSTSSAILGVAGAVSVEPDVDYDITTCTYTLHLWVGCTGNAIFSMICLPDESPTRAPTPSVSSSAILAGNIVNEQRYSRPRTVPVVGSFSVTGASLLP